MRRAADGAMRGLARLLIRIFFRRIEVEGLRDLPAAGPCVVVANHINGLVDALLLMATLPRFPRFLGKSTLFRILPLWPFLKLAGVVPVYRAKDGESTARNEGSFRTCRLLLAHGSQVALFPEGISHDESMLQPLKTGAARIALGAAVDDGVPGVVIVPVGLSYDAKATFRSRALVHVGVAQPVDPWADRDRTDGHQAVRDLTAEMADRLGRVSPTYRSWMQATVFRQIAEVVARPTVSQPGTTRPTAAQPGTTPPRADSQGSAERSTTRAGDVELARREATARMFAEAEESGQQGLELAALHEAYGHYERDLALIGLTDEQVCARDGPGRRRLALAWATVRVLAALPAAAVGTVVHVVPYRIMKKLGSLPRHESIKATVELFGCFVLFTV
ncbi:MAG TPA: 1-acyl-sn-glycerol-3-phosphate acyltransferase, partial [Acidimicrobiales bacterium]